MEIDRITVALLETAFKQWHQAQEPPAELLALDLLGSPPISSAAERAIGLYDYFADLVRQQLTLSRQSEAFDPPRGLPLQRQALLADLARDFGVSNANLEGWSILYHRYLAPLPLTIQELAKGANVEERQIRRRLELGLRLLVDLVRRAEKATHEHQQVSQRRRHLPPAEHTRLFGVEQILDDLARLLLDPVGAPFVSLEGLGGIGKTTLARVVADQLAAQTYFTDILWVQARSQQINAHGELQTASDPPATMAGVLAQLATQLGPTEGNGMPLDDLQAGLQASWANHPYLIIVDNLEAVADADELLATLHALAGQSRFLVTSRHTLRYYPFVQTFCVPELSRADSLALMRYEVQRRQDRCTLSDLTLTQIYATIGGVPLAIRLVTAQVGRLSLTMILDGLRQARAQLSENMYVYIYQRAWQLLSLSARRLLLLLSLIAPAGEDVAWMANKSAYTECQVQVALTELADYSLVEVCGETERPQYKLHQLTHTFLQTQTLAQWTAKEKTKNPPDITVSGGAWYAECVV